MSRLFLLLVLTMTAFVAADVDYAKGINKELQLLQLSSEACPASFIGLTCPEANLFFYYKCCGPLSKDCCQTPQNWVKGLAVVLAVLIGLTAICCCICCLCACSR